MRTRIRYQSQRFCALNLKPETEFMTAVNGLSRDNYAAQFWLGVCAAYMARYAHHAQITSQGPAVTRLLTCMNASNVGRKPASEHD